MGADQAEHYADSSPHASKAQLSSLFSHPEMAAQQLAVENITSTCEHTSKHSRASDSLTTIASHFANELTNKVYYKSNQDNILSLFY